MQATRIRYGCSSIAAAHGVTREFFFTATSCLGVLRRRRRRAASVGGVLRRAASVAWLLSSKAFIDYTSSGLENPLSYFCSALFSTRYLTGPYRRRRRRGSCACSS